MTPTRHDQLIADVRAGLSARPYTLPPKWFYDARGSKLFDAITRLPEYYPTRAERALLADCADTVVKLTEATTLVELGSGTSDKTRLLLDAFTRHGTLEKFVPLDVDPTVLQTAQSALAAAYPGLLVAPLVADFDAELPLPTGDNRLVAFLGSTIGNFEPGARAAFLARLAAAMDPGDHLLLGADLVKDVTRLIAAYDDSQGVTAEFNRNVLRVLESELGAEVDPASFDHVALWDDQQEWIEMRLRSRVDQEVAIPAADLVVSFAAGDEIRTEISAKFRRDGVTAELTAAGFDPVQWWDDGDFGLALAVRS